MTKKCRLLILISVLLLLASLAHAASFDAEVLSIKDKIVVDEVAEFDIVITNHLQTSEEFLVKKTGYPFWDMYTKPLQNPITLTVPGQSSAKIRIFVHPLYITSVDTYTLDTGIVLQRTDEEQKVPVTIGIRSNEPLIGGYIPTVVTSTSILPIEIDPREEFKIRIVLNNQNLLDYKNLTVRIESNLFRDELYVPLGPKEDKTIEITKRIDAMTPPQSDSMVVEVLMGQRLIVNPIINEFDIKSYSFQESLPREQSFLKVKKGIKVVSNDADYKAAIKMEISGLKSLVTTSSPKAETVKEGGKSYLAWDIPLGEDRTVTVYTTENYRPILVTIVLIIAALVLYFVFRSPLIVRKGVVNIGLSDGGVSEAKVVVRVKNRSSKPISNIDVSDNVPHIAHVEKELSVGSMQPHAILQHPKRGIMIKWTIENLEPGDERVLSYKMRSRLAILGEFNLPAASARASIGKKMVITHSNRVSVGG